MCGAIKIPFDSKLKDELKSFFPPEALASFEHFGEVTFAFWDENPVLPIRQNGKLRFVKWGNRDGQLRLPKTGWARLESLQQGKWNHFNPKVVLVPASQGCDKKVWFDLETEIKAVLVRQGDEERIYIITEEASEEFLEMTGHDRMPRLMPKKS